MKVLGLGTAAMDIVLQCESLPREDGFAFVHYESLFPGGSCANVLVALARMGVDTSLVAKIGDDKYGEAFREDIVRSGVCARYLFTRPGGITLHTFVTLAPNGARAIFCHLGDSLLDLAEDEVVPEMLQGVKVFYTDMFPGRPALKLARLSRELGVRVFFNLECAPSFMQLCRVTMAEIEEMISLCDLLCMSREGLFELTGVEDPQVAGQTLYQRYRPTEGIVSTCGTQGAIWWLGDKTSIFAPAFNIQAIDTTGAGDAFIAGLIYAYFCQEMGRQRALEFANACGAIKCTQLGARFKASLEEVNSFLTRNNQ
ncbi:Sulfofructose kinase [Neomoorella glycerini]|uniref:Sulfofructose kinase n=1 Tax=Neomoorella glycerini TaxID=55779 RepID=A0A6I5ZTX9_9FIRM|nr:carbohydrate kinase family protein [Moorella glycerini]QGP93533.1 Sulfofructose kinase [Moorella glycerini]